ncbi:lysophospholipid acyltransferase family protein [Gilvibacter sp.]|uniref:lysophospholipid acyltransferase family protein n=1 Tax=Gilvibacter sp. TaxID=2729997 RepID=UPI003F4A4CB0
MHWISAPFKIIWRIWFYLLVALPIVVLFPVLLILISRDAWYPLYFKIARGWGRFVLIGMGFWPSVKRLERHSKEQSYMFVANHQSMTDIMLMLHAVGRPFVFVGKKELASIPVFGFFYKRTCILVDRSNAQSRKAVFEQAQERLSNGLSVCIFPEGGVPDDESIVLDSFKDGAFRLAIEHQIPIAPLVFYDNKKRFPFRFFGGVPGKMRALVLPTISTAGIELRQKQELRNQTRELILKELEGQKLLKK